MLRNILLITFRNFLRNWNHTVINVLGLSVGIASCIVIFLVINRELKFDKFHSQYDRIYRVTHANISGSGVGYATSTPYPFINAFHQDFHDVPLATEFHYHEGVNLTYGDEKSKVPHVLFADSLFFKVFDFEVLEGNPARDLGEPGKVFLTKSLATKLLKLGGPRTIKINNKLDVEVAGIIADPPLASHIRFEMIVSMPSFTKDFLGFPIDSWGMESAGYAYMVLPDGVAPQDIEDRLVPFIDKFYAKDARQKKKYSLQPLSDIHFNEQYQRHVATVSGGITKSNLTVLGLLGVFLLTIASINFVNLSTALAIRKSREIGVRKTLGATKAHLSRQFMMEAFLMTLLSLGVAVGEVELVLPFVSDFLDQALSFGFADGIGWAFLGGLVIITTLLAGAYPAWVLARFNPVAVLKNRLTGVGTSGSVARKYLVGFQFLLAQILIIGTLVVSDQMEYFQSKPLGFIKEGIVNVNIPQRDREKFSAFAAQLSGVAGVDRVSFSLGSPTAESNFSTSFNLPERSDEESFQIQLKPVDKAYAETYGLQMAAGRWFNENEESRITGMGFETPDAHSYVVNEALVRKLGFSSNEEIIGKKVKTGLNSIIGEVIGVVKDFHTASLHQEMEPAVMMIFPYFYYNGGIRFHGNVDEAMKGIEKSFNAVFPEFIFEYSFLDQQLENLYKDEKRGFALIRTFAGLSIFISCLGLLGLVSFITQQKVKEVGIRKVFGATVTSIVVLFSKGFAGLVGISFLMAAPLAWFLMNQWLEGFAYRTTIGWEVYVIAVVLTIVIAMLTVGYQSIRAARSNPATSLRSE